MIDDLVRFVERRVHFWFWNGKVRFTFDCAGDGTTTNVLLLMATAGDDFGKISKLNASGGFGVQPLAHLAHHLLFTC